MDTALSKKLSSLDPADAQGYPRSRASTTSDSPVVRSRTWSDDITKTWNVPITGIETFGERAERYLVYFKLNSEQLQCILNKFSAEMRAGLEFHREDPRGQWQLSKCSLKMADTHISNNFIPTGCEKGSSYVVDFGGTDPATVRAATVTCQGAGKLDSHVISTSLRDQHSEYPKGLLDRDATASTFFDCLARLVKQLRDGNTTATSTDGVPVALSIGFPIEQRAIAQASLIHWTKGFETGRKTNDPVEGMDLDALLDCSFTRAGVDAKTVAILNDTVGTFLACAYQKPATMPPCRVAFILGAGVNGCYVDPNAQFHYKYRGSIINCEAGCFDKSLPINDVDLEVDYADEATEGVQLYEKMVATTYLGELCRRVVVKVWQGDAPQLAWVRYSMPWLACARVIEDDGEDLAVSNEILKGLWEWEATIEERRAVKQLFRAVFDRSASLAAVAIVALSSQTGRLQPAMGGITCAMGGALFLQCPTYRKSLEYYINEILPQGTSHCIHFHAVEDGAMIGAGIVGAIAANI